MPTDIAGNCTYKIIRVLIIVVWVLCPSHEISGSRLKYIC
nr:MAG TPA: hypothetical protein [Caudoviricetes sp.]